MAVSSCACTRDGKSGRIAARASIAAEMAKTRRHGANHWAGNMFSPGVKRECSVRGTREDRLRSGSEGTIRRDGVTRLWRKSYAEPSGPQSALVQRSRDRLQQRGVTEGFEQACDRPLLP